MAGEQSQNGSYLTRVRELLPRIVASADRIDKERRLPAALADEIPMRRLGTPEEVASTIYFLCSSQASYVSGTEVHVNGGQHV